MPISGKWLAFAAGLASSLAFACNQGPSPAAATAPPPPAAKTFALADFYGHNDTLAQKIDSLYNRMGPNERAAQLIMPATGVSKKYGLPFSKIIQLYKEKKIGGVLFLKGTRKLFTDEITKLNALAVNTNLLPLVYSCDCEPALFHRKFTDADSLTPASLTKTAEAAAAVSQTIATEMKKMGIHWNFAPVVDVNSNKAIINNRSYGSDPKDVVAKSVAFIKAAAANNIATTIKHFPGHGAISGDTHKQLLYINQVMAEVNNFQAAMYQAAPISVMTGHIAVEQNDVYSTGGLPASLSPKIVSYLLKNNLGFSGIVVTDAMNMGAVQNIPDADYLAIQAGNDLVVMPQQVERLHQKIMAALASGKPLGKQLEISIKKILRLKICLGIIN